MAKQRTRRLQINNYYGGGGGGGYGGDQGGNTGGGNGQVDGMGGGYDDPGQGTDYGGGGGDWCATCSWACHRPLDVLSQHELQVLRLVLKEQRNCCKPG
jgi:hypothetical protein